MDNIPNYNQNGLPVPSDEGKEVKGRLFSRTMIALAAVGGLAAFGIMAYFLIKYPIPLISTEDGPKGHTDLVTIIFGFIVIVSAIRSLLKNKYSAGKPQPAPKKLEWKTLSPAGKIYWGLVIASWVAILSFVLWFGILGPILSNPK